MEEAARSSLSSSAARRSSTIPVSAYGPRVDFLLIFGRGVAVNVIKPRDPPVPAGGSARKFLSLKNPFSTAFFFCVLYTRLTTHNVLGSGADPFPRASRVLTVDDIYNRRVARCMRRTRYV